MRGGAAVEGSVEVEAFIVVEVENGLLCCSVSGVMSCLVLPAPFPLRVHGLCQSMPSLCPPLAAIISPQTLNSEERIRTKPV